MGLNDKLQQLKNNISSFKQDMATAISSKGGSVTSASTLDEMVNSVNTISGGGKMKWFDGLRFTSSVSDSELENIMSGVDFSEVTDFSDLLRDRSSFTTFPAFDTSKAKNLNNLFRNCTNLVSLPYFDVSNAESIEGMIEGCTKLTDVGGFGGLKQDFKFVLNSKLSHDSLMNIINNLATVSGKKLSIGQNNRDRLTDDEIAIASSKGWNVLVKLPYQDGLFKNDSTTTDEVLENVFQAYDTANYKSMSEMFENCSSITTIPLFDTNNSVGMRYMFKNCSSLITIPEIDTSNAELMYGMFYGCSSLTSIPQLDTSKINNMDSMFCGCNSLITIPELDTSNIIDMRKMFSGCTSLESIPFINTSNVTNMYGMFYGCSSLTSIPQLDTSNVTDIYDMFRYCSSLTSIPQLNTSKAINFSWMFQGCSSLITIKELDTSNVTDMYSTFDGCTNLRYMLLKNLGTQNSINNFMYYIHNTKWGVEDSSIPLSIGARQSMIDSMITYSFDRASAGYSPLRYSLSSASKAVLTEEEIAAVTAKGYTIA